MDVCSARGGREWRLSPCGTRICRVCLHRANRAGLRLDEWAESQAAQQAREVEAEVGRTMAWYATDCARLHRPL
jgi:hypothetical protein